MRAATRPRGIRRVARILISAGDLSGQRVAAGLVGALRSRRPETRFAGLVGPPLEALGVEPVAEQASLAVGGALELLPSAAGIAATWRRMTAALGRFDPDLVVLVDAGGFNLPFARRVRRTSRAKILYAVPPQVWAWRTHRLPRLAARVDRIATVWPFESDFYAEAGVKVDFVGHPILDTDWAAPVDDATRTRARRRLGLADDLRVVGVFPGSRRNEVRQHLDRQLAALARVRDGRPKNAGGPRGSSDADAAAIEPLVVCAPSIDASALAERVRRSAWPAARIVPADRDAIDAIDVAIAKPGTLTLELLLRERPMVVIGRANPLSAAWVRRSLRTPWLALPNLIAGEAIVPELLQADATPERIAAALAELLPERGGPGHAPSAASRRQIDGLRAARERLGAAGASARLADLAERMLGIDHT